MQKPMSSRALRIRMILFELLSTQALVTSVKTLYLLHFLMQNADISLFKLAFTFLHLVLNCPVDISQIDTATAMPFSCHGY